MGFCREDFREGRELITGSVQPQKLGAMAWVPAATMPAI